MVSADSGAVRLAQRGAAVLPPHRKSGWRCQEYGNVEEVATPLVHVHGGAERRRKNRVEEEAGR